MVIKWSFLTCFTSETQTSIIIFKESNTAYLPIIVVQTSDVVMSNSGIYKHSQAQKTDKLYHGTYGKRHLSSGVAIVFIPEDELGGYKYNAIMYKQLVAKALYCNITCTSMLFTL